MEHRQYAQQESSEITAVFDTPPASIYQEYDRRKAELWLKYGPGDEYDLALRDLIDELGV